MEEKVSDSKWLSLFLWLRFLLLLILPRVHSRLSLRLVVFQNLNRVSVRTRMKMKFEEKTEKEGIREKEREKQTFQD